MENDEYVGVGARFGPTLESKEKHATHTRVVMADPPDCCSKPKNKVFLGSVLNHRTYRIQLYLIAKRNRQD